MAGMSTRELEGEFEGEFEEEIEGEFEEEGEEFLGTIARGIGGLLGGQGEFEEEIEGEFEEESEEFFRRIAGLVRRAAPLLRRVARVAVPIVGTAVGGPLGGVLGRAAASALGEEEYEFEGEFEEEIEGEFEEEGEEFLGTIARGIGGLLGGQGEFEEEFEEEAAPASQSQAVGELMAAVASQARTEAEAEAMIGAATVTVISPRDRAVLRRVLPHMVRGAAVLTRILRRRRMTRPVVRAVPTIVRGTSRTLVRRAAAGQPVTRRAAARVMATQTRRVLTSPPACTRAIVRNQRSARVAARSRPAAVRRPVLR
jgi:hypothetical protein